jgi:hypothetical protein
MNRGFALVTTMLLSFIAMGVIISLHFVINQGSDISSVSKSYESAKEAARGIAEYVMEEIILEETFDASGNIVLPICNGGNACNAGDDIDLGSYSQLGSYTCTATLLSAPFEKEEDLGGGVTGYYSVYSFTVTATDINNPLNRAVIDVVFELEE